MHSKYTVCGVLCVCLHGWWSRSDLNSWSQIKMIFIPCHILGITGKRNWTRYLKPENVTNILGSAVSKHNTLWFSTKHLSSIFRLKIFFSQSLFTKIKNKKTKQILLAVWEKVLALLEKSQLSWKKCRPLEMSWFGLKNKHYLVIRLVCSKYIVCNYEHILFLFYYL